MEITYQEKPIVRRLKYFECFAPIDFYRVVFYEAVKSIRQTPTAALIGAIFEPKL